MPQDGRNIVDVEPAAGVGKPFNFDAAAWAASRDTGTISEMTPIEGSDLAAKATDQISKLLSGELPDEVMQQVEIRAAEKANRAGLAGMAKENLTFRDLGLSAMDAINQGISAAATFEGLRIDLEKTNKALQLQADELTEKIRQHNDAYALSMAESDRSSQTLAMRAVELQSTNRRFRIGEENRLIIANSQTAIDGLQQNMDSLGGAFTSFNTALQGFVELNS